MYIHKNNINDKAPIGSVTVKGVNVNVVAMSGC